MPDQINPYASPITPPGPATPQWPLAAQEVRRKLRLPAWALLASVVVSLPLLIGQLAFALHAANRLEAFWRIALFAAGIYSSSQVLRGALAMLRLVDYRAAFVGVWHAMIPCHLGCPIALPFALYADGLLRNPQVFAAFSPEKLRLFSRAKPTSDTLA